LVLRWACQENKDDRAYQERSSSDIIAVPSVAYHNTPEEPMHPTTLPPRHHILPCGDLVVTNPYGGIQIDVTDWLCLWGAVIILDARARTTVEAWNRAYAADRSLTVSLWLQREPS
jgi:hypothetical protein